MSYIFEAVIKNKLGIHARIATLLVKTVSKYDAEAYILFHGDKVNIKHLIDVISLSITQNSVVEINVEGKDAAECSKELQHLIENSFGEIS